MKEQAAVIASRRQNLCMPISRLPSEVLVGIMELALQPMEGDATNDQTPAGRHYEILRSLAEVCWVWRTVILQTSAFWTMISSDLDPPLQKSILARSQDALLDVDSSHRGMHPSFLGLTKPHSHRWRSLRLLRARGRDLEIIEGCIAPELKTLLIVDSYGPKEDRHYNLPGNGLKRLSLSGLSVPWNLKGLIQLELVNVAPFGPSLDELVEVLTNSPFLTRLILSDFTVSPGPQHLHVSIRLPALIHLVLSKIGVSNIDCIAGSIEGFVCEYLSIEENSSVGGGMTELFLLCPSYLLPSIEFMIQNSNYIKPRFEIHLGWVMMGIEGRRSSGEVCLKINLPSPSVLEALTFLSTICFDGCAINLLFDSDLGPEELSQFMSFSQRTNIVGLSLRTYQATAEILRHLSTPRRSVECNEKTFNCIHPYLLDLRIHSSTRATPMQVLNMVEARYCTNSVEETADSQDQQKSLPPRALKYLDISGMRDLSDPVLRRLKSILGEDSVNSTFRPAPPPFSYLS